MAAVSFKSTTMCDLQIFYINTFLTPFIYTHFVYSITNKLTLNYPSGADGFLNINKSTKLSSWDLQRTLQPVNKGVILLLLSFFKWHLFDQKVTGMYHVIHCSTCPCLRWGLCRQWRIQTDILILHRQRKYRRIDSRRLNPQNRRIQLRKQTKLSAARLTWKTKLHFEIFYFSGTMIHFLIGMSAAKQGWNFLQYSPIIIII